MPPNVMNARELADLLGLTLGTIYKKVRRGEIPVVRIGRSVRFPRDEIERWLHEEMRAEPGGVSSLTDPGRFTATTCGGLRLDLRREALYGG